MSEPTKPAIWQFPIETLYVRPGTDSRGEPALVLAGLAAPEAGVYVTVPLNLALLKVIDPTQAVAMLASELENGFNTMLYLWNEPDQAVRDGVLSAEHAEAIKAQRARMKADA